VVRTIVLITFLALVGSACRDSSRADETSKEKTAAPIGPRTPPPTAPKKVDRPAEIQDDCANMYQLLVKCSGNQRLRSDGHFKRLFLNNCRREVARDTAYAERFAECAASKDCPTLDSCSRELEKAAAELGPEHFNAIMAEGKRQEAKKFCNDNIKAVEASAVLHDLCHPLLEEVEREKAAAEEEGGCPFHDEH